MYKIIVFFTFILAFSFGLKSQYFPHLKYKTPTAKLDSVISFDEFWYGCVFPENENDFPYFLQKTKYYFYYDDNERLIRFELKYSEYISTTTYKYEGDKIIEIEEVNDYFSNKKVYTYSQDSNYFYITSFYAGNPNTREFFYYDDNDSIIENITQYYQQDEWNSMYVTEYEYNPNNTTITEYYRYSDTVDWNIGSEKIFEYKNDNLVKQTDVYFYDYNGQNSSDTIITTYNYDSENKIISKLINYCNSSYVGVSNTLYAYEYTDEFIYEYHIRVDYNNQSIDTVMLTETKITENNVLYNLNKSGINLDTVSSSQVFIYDKDNNVLQNNFYIGDFRDVYRTSSSRNYYWNYYSTDTVVNELDYKIYPNPTTETVFLFYKGHKAIDYNLYSLDGKLIVSGQTKTDRIDVSFLPRGIYLLKLYSGFNVKAQKIIKN